MLEDNRILEVPVGGGVNPPNPPVEIPDKALKAVAIIPGTATPTIASVTLSGPGILPIAPTPPVSCACLLRLEKSSLLEVV